MDERTQQRVYAGRLDYSRGRWWVARNCLVIRFTESTYCGPHGVDPWPAKEATQ